VLHPAAHPGSLPHHRRGIAGSAAVVVVAVTVI
jgi:hypothetical protein